MIISRHNPIVFNLSEEPQQEGDHSSQVWEMIKMKAYDGTKLEERNSKVPYTILQEFTNETVLLQSDRVISTPFCILRKIVLEPFEGQL